MTQRALVASWFRTVNKGIESGVEINAILRVEES